MRLIKVGKNLDCLATISLAPKISSLIIKEIISTILTLPNPTVYLYSFVILNFEILFSMNDESKALNSLTLDSSSGSTMGAFVK